MQLMFYSNSSFYTLQRKCVKLTAITAEKLKDTTVYFKIDRNLIHLYMCIYFSRRLLSFENLKSPKALVSMVIIANL